MFGLPIYRHRYFETNFFWPQPGHPKHVKTRQVESSFSPRPRGVWEQEYEAANPGRSAQAARVNTGWRIGHDGQGVGKTEYKGSWDRYKHTSPMGAASGKAGLEPRHPNNPKRLPAITDYVLSHPQGNGAQKPAVAVGHAAGWRIAAEAMDVGWMRRYETTQAVPPCMTEHIGRWSPPILEAQR